VRVLPAALFQFGGKSIRLLQRLKASLIREHLPQRWKRCATQKQSFSAICFAATAIQRQFDSSSKLAGKMQA
jgi:hypothetical protein